MERPLLLLIGQVVQPTGLARVVRELAQGLSPALGVHVLGLDAQRDEQRGDVQVHACSRSDAYGASALPGLLTALRPAAVLVVCDLWMVPLYSALLRRIDRSPPLLAYVPLDAEPQTPELLQGLSGLSLLILYTEFARRSIAERAAAWQIALPPIALLPHGVDRQRFAPIDAGQVDADQAARRQQARRALFPDRPDLAQAFLVLNCNRNQPRKRLDLTLHAFAAFAAGKPPGVRLCLHSGRRGGGCDVPDLARRLGIADRLILTAVDDAHPAFSDQQLNLLYNACEVGINTALGEGWGLCSFEHAATGAAQVVPAHSACLELWHGAAELVPVRRRVPLGPVLQGAEIDPAAAAAALERLYSDRAHLEAMSAAALRRAADPALRWSAVGARCRQLIQSTLNAT